MDMEPNPVEYRGFQITVTPTQGHDGLWDFKYHIAKSGDPSAASLGHSVTRRQTMDGYETAAIACDAGVEVAKTEIDNYLALSGK